MRHTIYKWTSHAMRTRHGYQWEVGKEHRRPGREPIMCNSDWLHAYTSPRLAVLLDPAHGHYTLQQPQPKLWVGEGWGRRLDDGAKVGHSRMRWLEEVPVPAYTETQRIYFALRCSLAVCDMREWRGWVTEWIQGWRRPCPLHTDDLYFQLGPVTHKVVYEARKSAYIEMGLMIGDREWSIWAAAANAAVLAQRNLNGSLALDEMAKDALEYRG